MKIFSKIFWHVNPGTRYYRFMQKNQTSKNSCYCPFKAAVKIVTGDTKVVLKGQGDQIFINTSGVGVIPAGINSGANNLQVGDRILINGFLGDHGAAILIARGELDLQCTIESDCQALNSLISAILAVCPQVKAMRDATRGGLATVLNEFAQSSGVGIQVQETAIPIREEVRGMCELLGLEPLYLANEGKLVLVVPPEAENPQKELLKALKKHDIQEAVIRLVYKIRSEQLELINTNQLDEALKTAHSYSIRAELISQLTRPRLPELGVGNQLDPMEALKAYIDNKTDLRDIVDDMLEAAQLLLNQQPEIWLEEETSI